MTGDGRVIEGNFGQRSGKPWPADQWPTAEQFADWYVEQPREERVRQAHWIVLQGQEAERCVRGDHDGRIAQLEAALQELYRQAVGARREDDQ